MKDEAAREDPRVLIARSVDSEVLRWRQGDVVDDIYALRLVDLKRPLTPASEALRITEGLQLADSSKENPELAVLDTVEPLGYVIISQTCDVVRSVSDQPHFQACPIVEIPDGLISQVRKSESTRIVWLPALNRNVGADLTRTFSAEKSVLVGQNLRHGVETDEEIRNFAMVVARRFGRFAFPDDLHTSLHAMRTRLISKHKKNSDEGAALRNIHQIRAEALPGWNATSVEIVLHFILEPHVLPEVDDWSTFVPVSSVSPSQAAMDISSSSGNLAAQKWVELAQAWVSLCRPAGVIKSISAQVSGTSSFTLEQMRNSEQLDLDYLSISTFE